jgi:hypothetical protein
VSYSQLFAQQEVVARNTDKCRVPKAKKHKPISCSFKQQLFQISYAFESVLSYCVGYKQKDAPCIRRTLVRVHISSTALTFLNADRMDSSIYTVNTETGVSQC